MREPFPPAPATPAPPAPPVPEDKIGWALARIRELAGKRGAHVYDIRWRSAGVGVMWWERDRQGSRTDYADGLHCYGFYGDIGECLAAELVRLLAPHQRNLVP